MPIEHSSKAQFGNNAFVSIIVPIRNEGRYITGCLNSIYQQDYPHDQIELFVVDGCSTDHTREIVQSFENRDIPLTLLDNPGRIVPIAMNIALRKAKGDVIVRVDGHCEIAPDYISRCVEHIERNEADGIGGSMDTIGETPLSWTIAAAMSSVFGVGGSAFRTTREKTVYVDTVPFPAYTRSIIKRVGLYDEELIRNQDDEYNYRIREMGGRLLLAADVKSKYYSRGSLQKLWRQYFQYGYWKVRVMQKHPQQMRLRQFFPAAFVGVLAVSFLAALLKSRGWILLAIISGMYLAANLTFSLLTALRLGAKHLIRLPLCFSILHLSYGAGFLIGSVRFLNRWNDRSGKTPPSDLLDIDSIDKRSKSEF